MSVPAHTSLLVRNVVSIKALTSSYLEGTVVRSHPMAGSPGDFSGHVRGFSHGAPR